MWFVQFSRHSQEETLLPSRWSNIITRIPNLTHSKTIFFISFFGGKNTHKAITFSNLPSSTRTSKPTPFSHKTKERGKKCNRIPPHNQRKREKTKRQKWSLSAAVKGHKKSWWTPALEALMGLPRPLPLPLSLPRAHSSCTSVAELKIVVFVKLLLSPIHYREGDAAWGNYSGSAMAWSIIEGTIARVMGAFFFGLFSFLFVGDSGRGDI